MPLDYYSSLMGIMADVKTFELMLMVTLPKVYALFRKVELDTSVFVIPWFLCIYTQARLGNNVVKAIWDRFLLSGHLVVFKAALVILKILSPHLMACPRDFVAVMKCFETQVPLITDGSAFQSQMRKIYLNRSMVYIVREKYYQFLKK